MAQSTGAGSIRRLSPDLDRVVPPGTVIDKVAGNLQFAEGPVWLRSGGYLLFSDIPANAIMKWTPGGSLTVFRKPIFDREFSQGIQIGSNGLTLDRQGRLIACEHGNRRVSRIEKNGSISTLADRYEGKRLNSPNDVVVKSDGSIWFTDPTYGIDSDYEGDRAESEIGASHVYRVDPQCGAIRIVADDFIKPNGLAFSPDEKKLYIADTGRTHGRHNPAHIRVFDVRDDGTLRGGGVFANSTAGLFDGFRLDEAGRLWSSSAEGIHCFHPDGTLIGKILVPETVSNICFGGLKRNQLFICGTTSLYAVHLHVNGARTF